MISEAHQVLSTHRSRELQKMCGHCDYTLCELNGAVAINLLPLLKDLDLPILAENMIPKYATGVLCISAFFLRGKELSYNLQNFSILLCNTDCVGLLQLFHICHPLCLFFFVHIARIFKLYEVFVDRVLRGIYLCGKSVNIIIVFLCYFRNSAFELFHLQLQICSPSLSFSRTLLRGIRGFQLFHSVQ